MNLPRIKSHNLVSAPKVTVHQNPPNTNAIMHSFPPLIHSAFATNSCPRINSKALQARSSGDTKISPKGDQNVQAFGLMGWGLKGHRKFCGKFRCDSLIFQLFLVSREWNMTEKVSQAFFSRKGSHRRSNSRENHWRMHRLAMIHIPLVLKANM